MAFVGRNEKNGAGIQESYVAMETTAKRALETQRWREICAVCRDGQIFLSGNIQVDVFFFVVMSVYVRYSLVDNSGDVQPQTTYHMLIIILLFLFSTLNRSV